MKEKISYFEIVSRSIKILVDNFSLLAQWLLLLCGIFLGTLLFSCYLVGCNIPTLLGERTWWQTLLELKLPQANFAKMAISTNIFWSISWILWGVISIACCIGGEQLVLDIINNGTGSITRVWIGAKKLLAYIGADLISLLILLLGLVACVIPGIWASNVFYFSSIIVLDKNIGSTAAVNSSLRLTEGYRWQIFWFRVLSMVLTGMAGMVHIILGLIVTIIFFVAKIVLYRTLVDIKKSKHAD